MEKRMCHRCKKDKVPFKALQITSSDGTKTNIYICAECVENLMKFHAFFDKSMK